MLLGAVLVVVSYLCGSVASAIVVCRIAGLPDPRGEGSGNPGATNVLRIGGKGPAGVTLLGDVAKGVFPVLAAHALDAGAAFTAGCAVGAFLGHLYPIFFRFQGGKGVATALGAVAALAWPVGLAMAATWLVVAAVSRYSSLSSITAAILAPAYALVLAPEPAYVAALACISVLLVWRHRENVKRLAAGNESRIGQRREST